jgi:hypothetical protein
MEDEFLLMFPSYTLWSSEDGTPLVRKRETTATFHLRFRPLSM